MCDGAHRWCRSAFRHMLPRVGHTQRMRFGVLGAAGTLAVVALAACSESRKAPSTAELARYRALAIRAVEAIRPVCRPGEVVVSVSRTPTSTHEACTTPHDAPATVERMLRRADPRK